MLPALLSWGTLLGLLLLSYFQPVFVAYFIIAFDVYWLLLVTYLGIHLVAAFRELRQNQAIDWNAKCRESVPMTVNGKTIGWQDVVHLIILPTYQESIEIVRSAFDSILADGFPTSQMIIVLAMEERAGAEIHDRAEIIRQEYGSRFRSLLITFHPDGIEGELKGKGANQAWAAKEVRREIIDKESIDPDKILVSIFDMDTVVYPGYFALLTYKFLTVENPYRASYQPIPMYHNNIWQAPFFARVAASSNTFWQMMQQIRVEKLATYSSHSMTWRALTDIGFWSTNMVSEDSRIFWHCFCYYKGDYRVEPMHFPVSMDVCMDETFMATAKNLYKQQRRWGWGVENLPYLTFNLYKNWRAYPKAKMFDRIFVQLHGFHSWATNALIIAVIGWMPMLLGGDRFNSTVLSGNLPVVTRTLMTLAMGGMVLSAVISTMLLPQRPKHMGFMKTIAMVAQWAILPVSIIVFGAIPGLEAQTRLMLGKYMGFFVTPKKR